MPPEGWNRLGTKILPKLRSGDDLSVGIEFSVSVGSAFAKRNYNSNALIEAWGKGPEHQDAPDDVLLIDLGALGPTALHELKDQPGFEYLDAGGRINFPAIRNKLNIVRAAVARRNEFAHGQVNEFEGKGYFLVPSQFDWRKTPLWWLPSETMKYFYTSNDIRTMAEKFTLLDKELFNLETDTLAAIHKTYPLTRPPWYGKSST